MKSAIYSSFVYCSNRRKEDVRQANGEIVPAWAIRLVEHEGDIYRVLEWSEEDMTESGMLTPFLGRVGC